MTVVNFSKSVDSVDNWEIRPWGKYLVLADLPYTKVKRIIVNPGKRLSLQSHTHRSEVWTCVQGIATIEVNNTKKTIAPGEFSHIPLGSKHRLSNESLKKNEIVEVQTGSFFGEDDIIRYEDDFGRIG